MKSWIRLLLIMAMVGSINFTATGSESEGTATGEDGVLFTSDEFVGLFESDQVAQEFEFDSQDLFGVTSYSLLDKDFELTLVFGRPDPKPIRITSIDVAEDVSVTTAHSFTVPLTATASVSGVTTSDEFAVVTIATTTDIDQTPIISTTTTITGIDSSAGTQFVTLGAAGVQNTATMTNIASISAFT